MFKKCLLFVCSVCGMLSVYAANPDVKPTDFSWNQTSEEQLTLYKNHVDQFKTHKRYVMWNTLIESLIILRDKSSDNITYDQFKDLIKTVEKKTKVVEKTALPQIVYCVSRFQRFSVDCLKDSEFKDLDYVKVYMIKRAINQKVLSPNEIQTALMDSIVRCWKIYRGVAHTNWCVSTYGNYLNEFDPTVAKADLKKMKLLLYPKIGNSDEIKKIVVNIELMIKALE